MPKKVNQTLEFINKFVGALLMLLITGMFTLNSKIGELSATIKLVSYKVDNILEEQSEIKTEQISRTDEIQCVDKIINSIGCNIPKDHGKYK